MIPENIEIHIEVKRMPAEYIYDVIIDNGVLLHCCMDGSAIGSDGKTYYAVAHDDENMDYELIGYSADIDAPIDDTKDILDELIVEDD